MLNAYDNSIIATDEMLDNIINVLEAENCVSAMIYLSDHGEDILDDARQRYLHASPVPTYYQLHVPFLIWMSDEYKNQYTDNYNTAVRHSMEDISSSRVLFHTILDMAGVESPYKHPEKSLVNKRYKSARRLYLTDLNEGLPLTEVGLRNYDFRKLKEKNIDYE